MSEPQHYWPDDMPRVADRPEDYQGEEAGTASHVMPITIGTDFAFDMNYRAVPVVPKAPTTLATSEVERVLQASAMGPEELTAQTE